MGRDRVAGDDKADAEKPGEGCKLFGRAGAVAVGRDHHRGNAGHHQSGCQPGDGQGLAGAGRTDQQQRLLAGLQRQSGERHRPGQRGIESPLQQGRMQRPRHRMKFQGGEPCGVLWPGRQQGRLVRFQRRGDFHPVTDTARREDQRILAQFGANPRHRIGHHGCAVKFQAHSMIPCDPSCL
jgi:hypothetical protein